MYRIMDETLAVYNNVELGMVYLLDLICLSKRRKRLARPTYWKNLIEI